MKERIEIKPAGNISAAIVLPGSKSETIRALICAALAEGESLIENALLCGDTLAVADSLCRLGVDVRANEQGGLFNVEGCSSRIPARAACLDLKGCASGMRFLASVSALGRGQFHFIGDETLSRRPLLVPLDNEQAGTWILFHERNGFLPFTVVAHGLDYIDLSLDCGKSSQALSSLLMAAPCAACGARIKTTGGIASAPYVDMTLKVMREFGVNVAAVKPGDSITRFDVSGGGKYIGRKYRVEGDASVAAYFLAAAAITGGSVRVEGCGAGSVQADAAFADILGRMGCSVEKGEDSITVTGPGELHAIDEDFFLMPDSAPTFAAVASFADGVSTMTGVGNLSLKESNRIDSIKKGLTSLGVEVETGDDYIRIKPGRLHGGTVDPRGDHRIAMSCALVGLKVPGVVILNPACVGKSLPKFFNYLKSLTNIR